jgi:hypothetical protein
VQINNLAVFTGIQIDRIVGFGDYFLSWESDGFDIDVQIYRIVGDAIVLVSTVVTVPTATAISTYLYRQANGRHVAVTTSTFGQSRLAVLVVATDGTTSAATGVDDGRTLDYRSFVGYNEGYCFIVDNASPDYAGGTLRQLAITGNAYAITTNPTNLTGTFNGGFASTNGYIFIQTSAGIEPYQRTGQTDTLTKLTVITPPTGYTFTETFGTNRWTQMGVYDDWLLVPVNEAPYLLTYRINRTTGTINYIDTYDSGITEAPRFIATGADAAFVGAFDSDEMAGAYTAAMSPDLLDVTYQGTFPNVLQYDDFTEQAARQAAEGGTGLYEAFQQASDIDGEPDAIGIAQAIIERYGRIPRTFAFDTLRTGLATGQIIDINWPSVGIVDPSMLIERIDTRDEGGKLLWYRVRCISGRDIGNWQEFWRSLRPVATSNFGGSDTLPTTRSVFDTAHIEDAVTVTQDDTETNWDEGNWNQMEWQ